MSRLDPWLIVPDDLADGASPAEQLEFLVNFARLAPSGYNRQPWKFRIEGDRMELRADPSRGLAVADPRERELALCCGTALYYIRVAAAAMEIPLRIEVPQSGRGDILARLRIQGSASRPLSLWSRQLAAIPFRRSDPEPFLEEAVPATVVRALERLLEGGFPEGFAAYAPPVALKWLPPPREDLACLVEEAVEAQWKRIPYRKELARWIRPAREDGITLGYSGWMARLMRFFLPFMNLGVRLALQAGELVDTSPLVAVLGTGSDRPIDRLACGECLGALLLTARSYGLSSSFFYHPVQHEETREELARLCHLRDPQVVLRLGYGGTPAATPRRSLKALVERSESPAPAGTPARPPRPDTAPAPGTTRPEAP